MKRRFKLEKILNQNSEVKKTGEKYSIKSNDLDSIPESPYFKNTLKHA